MTFSSLAAVIDRTSAVQKVHILDSAAGCYGLYPGTGFHTQADVRETIRGQAQFPKLDLVSGDSGEQSMANGLRLDRVRNS